MALLSKVVGRVLLCSLGTAFVALAESQAVDEYQLKAAFLYNFTKFVDWPEQAFKSPAEPLVICVVGQNPFGQALEDAVAGKKIGSRAIVVRQVSDIHQAAAAHILFVASSERKRYRAILESAKPFRALTVGEDEEFLDAGGVVGLKLDSGRVHLEISLDAAEQHQLSISSKLLSLAQVRRK